MQSLPAAIAGVFRFLDEERLDYCVLGGVGSPARHDCVDLVVAQPVMDRLPALLRSFGARIELELIDRRQRPDRVDSYRLSATSREERPQFLTIEARSDYVRCGHVVFTADELLRDRVRAFGFAAVAPAKEFVCHLLRCVDAGAITAGDAESLSAQW